MRKKMSLQDLKDLFPAYEPHAFTVTRATNKGFAHVSKPAYKAPKSKLTPAQWGRKQRGEPAPYNYKGVNFNEIPF